MKCNICGSKMDFIGLKERNKAYVNVYQCCECYHIKEGRARVLENILMLLVLIVLIGAAVLTWGVFV